MRMDETLARVAVAVDVACLPLAAFILVAGPAIEHYAQRFTMRGELSLILVGMPAALIYGVALFLGLRLVQVKLPSLAPRLRPRASKV